MRYRIGLDIGITSVGWATILLDDNGVPYRIGKLGVRLFDTPENPKDGSSLAAPRREARGMRRRLRRHKHRLDRIKYLCGQNGLLHRDQLEQLYHEGKPLEDVYELRALGLDQLLNREQWTRVLVHLAQRRGFQSNRKNVDQGSEDGKLLSAVEYNKQRMIEHGYRTVGEMFHQDESFRRVAIGTGLITRETRNKSGEYKHTISRSLVRSEVEQLFQAQRQYGNSYATETFEQQYADILFSQRSFDQGPGGNSPYARGIKDLVGKCTFFKEELRAPKASYMFERFMLLTKVNHLRLLQDGIASPLSAEQRETVIQAAYSKDKVTYGDLRKQLRLDDATMFQGTKGDEKQPFVELKNYHTMRKVLDKVAKNYIKTLAVDVLETLADIFTYHKNGDSIERELVARTNFGERERDILQELNFSKNGHLSLKALRLIVPYLEQGHSYDQACTLAGLQFQANNDEVKSLYLPKMESDAITNPVVKRALSQSIKVVNAIIREYGSPVTVHIELARDIADKLKERNEATAAMNKNRTRNDRVKERIIREIGVSQPRGEDIVKMKLFEEQDGICLYSGEKLDLRRVFLEPGYADVDHIIPYSISYDDSYNNKVLVLGRENRQKGNRLPYQYLNGNVEKLNRFLGLIQMNRQKIPYKKQLLLQKKTLDSAELETFKERHLVDTRYITRELHNHIRQHLQFADSTHRKKVYTVNGPVTAYMRKRWGLNKNREENDLHHAMDAVVVACIDDGLVQRVTKHHQYRENNYRFAERDEDLRKYPLPWKYFRDELLARLSPQPQAQLLALPTATYSVEEQVQPIFVSRAPRRTVTGAAHKETYRSAKLVDSDGLTISKKPLTSLKLTKEGDIEGYYNPDSDRRLYQALLQQLKIYDGDAKKAFAEPFYKPTASGLPGPLVKSVKIVEKSTINVPVLNGKAVAHNDSMVRVDLFTKANQFYLVPIYVADTLKNELPNRASTVGKVCADWTIIDSTYSFLFSLYSNDVVRISHKKGFPVKINGEKNMLKQIYFYYKAMNISTAAINGLAHDGSFKIESLGVKTLVNIEKYEVDILGNLFKVKHETRQSFSRKRK